MATVPLKQATVRKMQYGKYPAYGITVPKVYLDNGLLQEGKDYQVLMLEQPPEGYEYEIETKLKKVARTASRSNSGL